MESVQKIVLDFGRKDVPVKVWAKEGDNESRIIEIIPLNCGQQYAFESGIKAQFRVTKPDKKSVVNPATIENGMITVELTSQILAAAGEATAEIALLKGAKILSTQTFIIIIEKSAYNAEKVESSDEYKDLVKTLADINNISVTAQKAVDAAKKTEDNIEIANKRIDNILNESNLTDNSELVDVRVGADGTVYNTAGTAVRKQIADLKNDVNEYIYASNAPIEFDNLIANASGKNCCFYATEDFTDRPNDKNVFVMNTRYSENYDIQTATELSTGLMYTRLVHRTTHNMNSNGRDWLRVYDGNIFSQVAVPYNGSININTSNSTVTCSDLRILYGRAGEYVTVPDAAVSINSANVVYIFVNADSKTLMVCSVTDLSTLIKSRDRQNCYLLAAYYNNQYMFTSSQKELTFLIDGVDPFEKNPYRGKTFSIMGDSISTYKNASNSWKMPDENLTYYSNNAGSGYLGGAQYQWWYIALVEKLGMTLLVNNSWSGRTVSTKLDTNTNLIASGACNQKEIDKLAEGNVKPDVIFIRVGINDLTHGQSEGETIGGYDFTYEPANSDDFGEAYALMLKRIAETYPTSEVWCITCTNFHRDVNFPGVYKKHTLAEVNSIIRKCAEIYGYGVIDHEKCGINYYNGEKYFNDWNEDDWTTVTGDTGTHPNRAGFVLMANKTLKDMGMSYC